MIKSFKSRALKRYWERSETRRLPSEHVARIAMILDALDTSERPQDMDLPGLRFHPLTGRRKGQYSVRVTANWRITFGWERGDAVDVDLVDYHGE